MHSWLRRLYCRISGGHTWFTVDGFDSPTYIGIQHKKPLIKENHAIYCGECRFGYIPCVCFFCQGRSTRHGYQRVTNFPDASPFPSLWREFEGWRHV